MITQLTLAENLLPAKISIGVFVHESHTIYFIIKMFIIFRCVFCKEYLPTILMTVVVGLVSLVTNVIDEVSFSRTLFRTAEC